MITYERLPCVPKESYHCNYAFWKRASLATFSFIFEKVTELMIEQYVLEYPFFWMILKSFRNKSIFLYV